MTKLCKDCKYFDEKPWNIPICRYLFVSRLYGTTHYCNRPITVGDEDLVKGPRYEKIAQECAHQRAFNRYTVNCGIEGIYWKPSLKYLIINILKKNEDSTIK